MRTIRWGIIGCGAVTEVKSGPALQLASHSRLVAVMRRNGELARDYAARHHVPRWYDQAEALIHDPEVDAVYIATPPDTHKFYTLLCARAGKPVYVEKPMALNLSECQAMLHACKSAQVPLFVAYYRRALPRFLKIKALLDEKAIGEVRFVHITFYRPLPAHLDSASLPWRVIPEVAGGGFFVDLASHMLDFLDFALGPIRNARGFATNQAHQYPAEDMVSCALLFESGVQGAASWCFSSFAHTDLTEIVGTEGKLSYSTFGSDPILLTTNQHKSELCIENPPNIQQPLIQQIVDTLNGVATCYSTGASAARTSRIMDRLLCGYYGAGGRRG